MKTVSESQHIYLLSSYVEGQGFSNKSKTPILCSSLDYLDSSINTDDPEDHLREMWSTFWLGQIMIISGLGVVVRTVIELVNHATAPEVPGDLFGDFLEPMDPVTSVRDHSHTHSHYQSLIKLFHSHRCVLSTTWHLSPWHSTLS